MKSINSIHLLKKLISIPSVSKNEFKISEFIFNFLKKNNLNPKIFGKNVYCSLGDGKEVLLLNSHTDTVPPANSWKTDPFQPVERNGRVYGLGACDAKVSLAAMLQSIINIKDKKINGKVIFAATCEEETGGEGLEKLIQKLGKIDSAIIGEPTKLNICIAQRGLLILKLISKGKAAHAAYSEKGINAIYNAFEDIRKIREIKFLKKHKLLGYPSIQVTMINAGVRENIIPDKCEFLLDIRSTPLYSHRELTNIIKKNIKSEVEIVSQRLIPKETSENEKIVKVAETICKKKGIGSAGLSDWVFLNVPTIKIGPGDSSIAHTANEYVEISQLKKAEEIYKEIIKNYFSI